MISPRTNTFLHDLTVVAILAAGAVVTGLAIDRARSHPLPLMYVSPELRVQKAAATLEPRPGGSGPVSAVRVIELAEFRALVEAKSGQVLDARPGVFYGLGHVPGALNVAREDFADDYAAHRAVLEADRLRPLAVYCSGPDCEDSQRVADGLAKLGYRDLLVFRGGWEEWTQAGLPTEH